ncbi:MAG: metal-dependent transcriptional regulator [Spirochaetales bacterium]|uniref:Transcriptional regulator MntR n=1 Tax=Candidatus Thalassospirochaeta sargassi TaxID=3119039 RepID=A0AAJ1IBV5_9SPIO|nr:metal-dependent transcriptional regulator [Spirochaetales bacterium]
MTKIMGIDIEELTDKFPAAAEYMIEIFIIERDYGIVKNSVIASRLKVSKPAVTQAMNRLKKYELIEQDLYGAIRMTEVGRVTAARLLKRHYLIERLLVEELDFHWVKSDVEASRLQAAISDDFSYFLFDKLGRPDTCPHGNPFPGSAREKEILAAPRLCTAGIGDKLSVVRITEEGEAAEGLLQFCYEHNIRPGRTLEIVEECGEAGIIVLLEGEKELEIPRCFAEFICCSGGQG